MTGTGEPFTGLLPDCDPLAPQQATSSHVTSLSQTLDKAILSFFVHKQIQSLQC